MGIADGLNGVAPGDVVAARKVYGYEGGQEQGTIFLPHPEAGNSSYQLIERAKAEARKEDWRQRIPVSYKQYGIISPRFYWRYCGW